MSGESSANSPKNAIPDRELTPELISKWDLDLVTIHSLDKVAIEKGCLLFVKGGIATEAHAGGRLTRAHNDIDTTFVNLSGLSEEQVFNVVEEIIKSEDTDWELYKRSPNKIEFREKEDERPFFNRRRLELEIAVALQFNPDVKKLIFTNGEEIKVNVTEFYTLIGSKIHKLFMVQEGPYERETNRSDYTDLERLINLPGYDKNKAVRSLAKKIKSSPDPEKEAVKEYDFIIGLLSQLETVKK